MRITADTNILLRATLNDDPQQSPQARALLAQASLIAVPVPVFCEFVWTLRRFYKRASAEIADAVEAILQSETVVTDRPAVSTGIDLLRAGGDFADGSIARQGAELGGDIMATFDGGAVDLLVDLGIAAATPTRLLAPAP